MKLRDAIAAELDRRAALPPHIEIVIVPADLPLVIPFTPCPNCQHPVPLGMLHACPTNPKNPFGKGIVE